MVSIRDGGPGERNGGELDEKKRKKSRDVKGI